MERPDRREGTDLLEGAIGLAGEGVEYLMARPNASCPTFCGQCFCFLILPPLVITIRVVYVYARGEVQNAEETDHYN